MATIERSPGRLGSRPEHRLAPPRRARVIASSLRTPAGEPPRYFDVTMLAGLPSAAQRWLSRAIDPGMLLVEAVELHMHGEIRLGRWRRFRAVEALVPASGFVWAARARVAGLRVSGFDSFADGRGRMRWGVFGAVPVQSGIGPDVTRSAAGRLAAESVLLPTTLVGARWLSSDDPRRSTFVRRIADQTLRVTVQVAADGRLQHVSMQRWGDPDDSGFAWRRFEVRFDGEHRATGIKIPDGICAAWIGTDGQRKEFFRAVIDAADLFSPGAGHADAL